MTNIKTLTLLDTANGTRDLVHMYFGKMNELDWEENLEVNDQKLNSILWQVCHMAWAQDFLILKAGGGEDLKIDWLDLFKIGSAPPEKKMYPSQKKALEVFNAIHESSSAFLNSIHDDVLLEPNFNGMNFKRGNTIEASLMHHIRHEGIHCGQLSLLAKLNGIKTF
jgi:hypothetical protein